MASHKREKEIRQAFAEEAAAQAEKITKSAGLSAETAADIRRQNRQFHGTSLQHHIRETFAVTGQHQHIRRQTKFLKGFGDRVTLTIGLLCTEVFTYEGLMVQKIEREMGVPLADVEKFNVKGKVLIYKKGGEVLDMPLKRAQEYARPECHHCGDFTGEVADISCGGVGSMEWTITILLMRSGPPTARRASP